MTRARSQGLHTYYGKSHILHDVGLAVDEGEITTLLGRNGAGKTTTLRSLMGLTPPRDRARAIFGTGDHATAALPHRRARRGLCAGGAADLPQPDGRGEPARAAGARPGPWTIERIYELFPRLAERRRNRGRQLSGGEQEMLSIARALLINPRLLILDEPSQGLAPLIVREVFRIVAQMRTEGISVLLVEQNVRASLEIADHAYVLDERRAWSIPAPPPNWRPTSSVSRRSPAPALRLGRRPERLAGGEPGQAATSASRRGRADRLAQFAGARNAEYRLDQRIELGGEPGALLGDVGGGDAGIVAGVEAVCRPGSAMSSSARLCGQPPGNRSRRGRARRRARGRAALASASRLAVSRPASAIATVWRRLNFASRPSVRGAGMLQMRSRLRRCAG